MKQSFKEIQIGQQLITKYNLNPKDGFIRNQGDKVDYMFMDRLFLYGFGGRDKPTMYFPEGTILKVIDKDLKGKKLILETVNDCTLITSKLEPIGILPKGAKRGDVYPSELKSSLTEYGDVLAHPDNIQYRVFIDGKMFKAKYYDDMGKIKAALLVMFEHYKDSWDLVQKYVERNPELEESYAPEYLEYASSEFKLTKEDTKNVQIMVYTNKKNPTVVDFNVYEYFQEIELLSTVTFQFGSATRELFKNVYKEKLYKYILVYVPDEYRKKNRNNYFDYASLKESQRIKDVLKEVGVKDIKKTTKHGKTAIAFKGFDDMGFIISKLNKEEYYILDCEGDELIEQNERFIKLKQLGFKIFIGLEVGESYIEFIWCTIFFCY